MREISRPKVPSGVDLGLAAATVVSSAASWLTWINVGASSRNSFEVFRTAQRFNLDALDPLRFVWFMSPVVTLGCLVLISIQQRRSAAVLVLIQSLLVSGVSSAVLLGSFDSGAGPVVGLAAAVAGIGLAIASLMSLDSQTRL